MTISEVLNDLKTNRRKKVIIDSDTYNEMDDQFAIAYALGAENIDLIALHAAPFHNDRSESFGDGMEKSFEEMHRVLKVCGKEGKVPVFRGSERRIGDSPEFAPVDSPAARNLIKLALESDEIIYVLSIGASTNVASAVMLEPAIKDRICVIWLGTHCFECDNLGEFNLVQDYRAGQILFNSGANLIILPACGDEYKGHGTQVLVTRKEGLMQIKGDSPACKFFRETLPAEFNHEYYRDGWQRVIWDIAAPGCININDAYEILEIPAPMLTDENKFAFDSTRHKIGWMERLDPKRVFDDTYRCIAKN